MATRYSLMSRRQKDLANERNRRWKEKNHDKVLAYKRKHYRENRDKYMTLERDRQYRKRYGITLAEYEAMLAAQGNRCAICSSEKAGNTGQCFAVDHCHETGKVRGLLCIKCNARLGWYETHRKAVANYLSRRV